MQTRDIARTELKGGGYFAAADGAGPHPGAVVIPEAYGRNDNIKAAERPPSRIRGGTQCPPAKEDSTCHRSRTTSRSSPMRPTRFSTNRPRPTSNPPPKAHGLGV